MRGGLGLVHLLFVDYNVFIIFNWWAGPFGQMAPALERLEVPLDHVSAEMMTMACGLACAAPIKN
jgi:hypothetical protein